MHVKHFEDLEIWKEARRLTKEIYRLTSGPKFSKDFGLRNQIQSAAISVMSILLKDSSGAGIKSSFSFFTSAKVPAAKCARNYMWQLTKDISQQTNGRVTHFI